MEVMQGGGAADRLSSEEERGTFPGKAAVTEREGETEREKESGDGHKGPEWKLSRL